MRPCPPARVLLLLGLVAVAIGFESPRTSVSAAGPALAAYYKTFTSSVIDSTYLPSWVSSTYRNADLDGDGNQDLVFLGGELVQPGKTNLTSLSPAASSLAMGTAGSGSCRRTDFPWLR